MNKQVISKSDLNRIDQMSDHEIDYSDIPPLTDEQLSAMKPLREVLPAVTSDKISITLGLDADIVHWFKDQEGAGADYQALINIALREYVDNKKNLPEDIHRRVIREELGAKG